VLLALQMYQDLETIRQTGLILLSLECVIHTYWRASLSLSLLAISWKTVCPLCKPPLGYITSPEFLVVLRLDVREHAIEPYTSGLPW
jgi:hypothetical protein